MIDTIVVNEVKRNVTQHKVLLEELKEKHVFVTGATGLIGSQFVLTLLEANRQFDLGIVVFAFVRSVEKANRLFGVDDNNLRLVVGDINSEIVLDDQIDYIVHGASVTDSLSFVQRPADTILTAIQGTKNILELANRKKVSGFVYLSSLEVYGSFTGKTEVCESDFGYLNPTQVRSSYSESKRLAETLCIAYAEQYQIPIKIARLCQTFGPGVDYSDNRVFAQFARAVIEKKDIVLHTQGATERNYCAISDAISGILTILIKGNSKEAYNIANEDTYISIKDMARLVIDLDETNTIDLIFDIQDTEKMGYNPEVKILLKTTKLEQLGWKAEQDLSYMFQSLIASLRERI